MVYGDHFLRDLNTVVQFGIFKIDPGSGMKTLLKSVFFSLALSTVVVSAGAQTVVWDQGPTTGVFAGSWVNYTSGQNFADSVRFTNDTFVDGLNYFTDFDLSSKTSAYAFHLKILSDNSGTPGSVLFQSDLGFTSFGTTNNARIKVATFSFAPQLFAANATYWVGLSGNGFEAAQASVQMPQDGKMAQFSGSAYSHMAGVGDQMFQLTAAPVPEPETYAMLLAGLGLLGAVAKRRKVQQA